MDISEISSNVREYMARKKITNLFEDMIQDLVVKRPADPIQHLITFLSAGRGPRLIIAGAPASGKGTQCEIIVRDFGVTHISTGDLLREAVAKGTELGVAAKRFMDNGELVPDSLIISVVVDRLNQPDCQSKGWLLDGFPRSRPQALALQTAGILPDKVILLDVPDSILTERVIGRRVDPVTGNTYHVTFAPPPAEVADRCIQRSDDTEEKVKNRLVFFHRNLQAIKDAYASLLFTVDGNRNKNLIAEEVAAIIRDEKAQ